MKFSKSKLEEDDFNVSASSAKDNLGKKGAVPKPGDKRKAKDEKFGYGGRKRKMKKNSKESTQDLNFNPSIHGNKQRNKNPGKFQNKNKTKVKRLGKNRRHQTKKK